MNVAELLERRRVQWHDLEQLCQKAESRVRRRLPAEDVSRLSRLYRAACADLALADGYHLPPDTVQYLHRLVGLAHNQLYRSRHFQWRRMIHELLVEVPQRLYADNFVRLAFVLFWGLFAITMMVAYRSPDFAATIVGKETLAGLEEAYANAPTGRVDERGFMAGDQGALMTGFYIFNNPRIGLQCFAFGLLFGVGGLYITLYNAAVLGSIFGYMAQARAPISGNFFHFVTAHGPMELTAIVLCAAAGMRLGFALVDTRAWPHEKDGEAGGEHPWDASGFRPGDDDETDPRDKSAVDAGDETAAGGRSVAAHRAARAYPCPRYYTRIASLRRAARLALPTAGAAVVMFVIAALIEGFLSPSSAPYPVKAAVAVLSAGVLMFYFIVLGAPRKSPVSLWPEE